MKALEIVQTYYRYFNNKNWNGMLSLLHPDIRHEANQGDVRIGLAQFEAFLEKMDECYEETLTELVFFTSADPTRIAVEFVVNGVYKKNDDGLPPAQNQAYVLPAGAFLTVENGKITRVTTYYNLTLWMELVS